MAEPWRGPDWFEPRLPTIGECSLASALVERARRSPDDAFATTETGAVFTNVQIWADASVVASQLVGAGIQRGDVVAVWLPNSHRMLSVIFACSMVGAVTAQINIAFRGSMLERALEISGARVLIAHGDLVERLDGASIGQIGIVFAAETFQSTRTDLDFRRLGDAPARRDAVEIQSLNPWDLAAIIFTSGTTGPSKGVRVSCGQLWTLGSAFYGFMKPQDRILLALPLFHIASLGALWGAMCTGATVAIMESFHADSFWDVVERTGATTNMGFAGAFMDLLMKAPPSDRDRKHDMRRMLVTSVSPSVRAFSRRFGVSVFAGYSMSETSVIAISPLDPIKDRTVGRARKGIQVRLVDENDIEVSPGQPGELVVRSELAWVLNDGYQGAPEATWKAWRNGWFHTGDLMFADEDGDLYYVDRLKDAIRRRGENISSVEVEAEVRAFPSVEDAAAIAVNTDGGEEVLVIVSARQGAEIDPEELIRFLIPRMPHFMVPRFVRVVASLPRTQTNKVQKAGFRAEGVTAGTWDREAAGIRVRRQKLSTV